jgi:curved DNA-binding protein CbpA
VEVTTARQILGVRAGDGWEVVRAAYRAQIREAHPDVAGAGGVDRTVELNAAYRTLSLAKREGRLDQPATDAATQPGSAPHAARPEWTPPPGPPSDVRLLGTDTLVLSSTPDETFRRLVEATHEIGEISFLDRSSAIFEAVLTLDDGTHASFVISLQWRAHDATCEAFCTLEALERAEHLDVSGVLEQLVPYIPLDRMR